MLFVFGVSVFFFFQAEDGIRDYKVTGVQTCALPILHVAGVGEFVAQVDGGGILEEFSEAGAGVGETPEIGRASCRERVENWVGDGALKKKNEERGSGGRRE